MWNSDNDTNKETKEGTIKYVTPSHKTNIHLSYMCTTLMTPIFAPMTRPRVTAGLMWHPDTWPMVWARLATVMPKQRAILTMFAWG